jgi:hypothetical protein
MFRHPKYYKELRKRNKSDQVISKEPATAGNQRAPGPGLKPQAASDKPQATDPEATSYKRQAPSKKVQASSHKLQAPRSLNLETIEND